MEKMGARSLPELVRLSARLDDLDDPGAAA
jgi:hypothetical protein